MNEKVQMSHHVDPNCKYCHGQGTVSCYCCGDFCLCGQDGEPCEYCEDYKPPDDFYPEDEDDK